MAVIKSGDSSDQMSVDQLSKAARVTIYDVNGNPQLSGGNVSVVNFPATQPVSISGTVPVSATALPLPSGAATAAGQQTDAITNTQLRASAVPISAATLPLPSGAAIAANQQVDALTNTQLRASAIPTREDLLTGRTAVLKTGTLVTTATTADQVVLTYTVTAGKTFYLCYMSYDVRLTAVSATASVLGTISLESPNGTKVYTSSEVNPTTSETQASNLPLPTPIPIPAGTVIRFVCTPAAVTSMTWIGNFGGYEA